MPKVVKHAWTHRPRSEGGTDPIDFPASGGELAIISVADSDGQTNPGMSTNLTWDDFNTKVNDAGAAIYSVVDTNTAVATSEPGFYKIEATIFITGMSPGDDFERNTQIWYDEDGGGFSALWGDNYPDRVWDTAHYYPGDSIYPGAEFYHWDVSSTHVFYNLTAGVTTVKFALRQLGAVPSRTIVPYMLVTRLSGPLFSPP